MALMLRHAGRPGGPGPLVYLLLLMLTFLPACGDDDGDHGGERLRLEIVSGDEQVGRTGDELPEPVVVRVLRADGSAASGVEVAFEVTAGGGEVSEAAVQSDEGGEASVRWTLGIPPVWNRLKAAAGGSEVTFTAWAEPGGHPTPELILQGSGFDLANEDLAFEEGRGLFLGTPGAILNLAAPGIIPVEVPLTGESLESPVGIAFGPTGDLYVCENGGAGGALKRIRPSGLCETLSDGFGGVPFALPNYVAVHGSDRLYLTSTCDDEIFEILPETGETREFLSISGPNGIALGPDERFLYITTENPLFFCQGPDVPGGLYRVSLEGGDGTPGPIEPLVEDFALAGDGLAFDEEGNLYVVFSGLHPGGRLDRLLESGVFVYTPDGRFNELFTVRIPGDIITNVAFGIEPFDPRSLYCYGFTGKLYRVTVGIRGRRLP